MSAECTTCNHPKVAEIHADLADGKSARQAAKDHGASLNALYRHIRKGHVKPPAVQEATALATGRPNGGQNGSGVIPGASATLRAVQKLAREAQRHLKDARQGDDHKATNGAITAAAKALELVGKLRGELHGTQVNVAVSNEQRVAVDLQASAQGLTPYEVTEQARTWLSAQLEAGDPDAERVVIGLMRMVRSADATATTYEGERDAIGDDNVTRRP